jgi:rare lipoprotein A (peptidoglycan hydrolase)
MNAKALCLTAFLVVPVTQAIARHGGNTSVFCDRRTATGTMDCRSLVFAHRTLPLNSVHRITCGAHSALARVVDRGPAAWTGRDIDLSPGAAVALGVNGLGYCSIGG